MYVMFCLYKNIHISDQGFVLSLFLKPSSICSSNPPVCYEYNVHVVDTVYVEMYMYMCTLCTVIYVTFLAYHSLSQMSS